MTEVIARVHAVHLVNAEQRQSAADPETKPPDLGCKSACFRLQLSSIQPPCVYDATGDDKRGGNRRIWFSVSAAWCQRCRQSTIRRAGVPAARRRLHTFAAVWTRGLTSLAWCVGGDYWHLITVSCPSGQWSDVPPTQGRAQGGGGGLGPQWLHDSPQYYSVRRSGVSK